MPKVKYKEFPFNPRKITSKQLEDLENWLREYGDLSGIIYNRKSKNFVGGNQRSKTMNFDECEIEIIKRFSKPDDQGTTAIGFLIWESYRYNYREVSWPPKKEKAANIIANKAGGVFDHDILQQHFKGEDLLKWGFNTKEIPWAKTESSSDLKGIVINKYYQVVIDCENEEEQEKIFNFLKKHNIECRILTL